ncbi:MAG TPA: bifunctional aspartate kinase/homoserine dehydrogenase I, partial [Puia sp.]
MQVLKFGGSSVANADNINKVIELVRQALTKDRTILVVSALGGITDMLIQAGQTAAAGDESYKEKLQEIERRHLDTVKALLPITRQSAALSLVKTRLNEIEDICSGVFLLGELSTRTQDKIVSYGELLSSLIVSARFASLDIAHEWKDSRDLIRTDSRFGHAAVDFSQTNQLIFDYVKNAAAAQLFVFPGFIAADGKGITTTLGRGGSDYTAAILAAAVDANVL